MNELARASWEKVDYGHPRSTTSTNVKRPRPLSHDEKRAAEAAFQGMPFNPAWSEASRQVYEGISNALALRTGAGR
jgi:hypothetical protein